jgi:hypothetical protein
VYRAIDAPGFTSPVIMSYRTDDRSAFLMRVIDWVMAHAGESVRKDAIAAIAGIGSVP